MAKYFDCRFCRKNIIKIVPVKKNINNDDIIIIDESRRPYVDLKNFQSILHLVVHTYRIIYFLQLYKCAIMYYY